MTIVSTLKISAHAAAALVAGTVLLFAPLDANAGRGGKGSGSSKQEPTVRDHRAKPIVRDHRAKPIVRDHRTKPIVRDHRAKPIVRDHRKPKIKFELKGPF